MAAAAVSLACPLRRSTRLAHAHSTNRQHHRVKCPRHLARPTPDPEPDHDSSSSSDPENELTPRALRALKRQRLALDPDGLPLSARPRTKKRRKDPLPLPSKVSPPSNPPHDLATHPHKRPSSPLRSPLAPKCPQFTDGQAHRRLAFFPTDSCHSVYGTATTSVPEPIKDSPSDPTDENRPSSSSCYQPPPATTLHNEPLTRDTRQVAIKPELSIPPTPTSVGSAACTAAFSDPSRSPEPLTPLTPLTPSPESSPSLPGHDRQVLPLSPPHDPLPPPASLDTLPVSSSSGVPTQQQSSTDSFAHPPLSTPPISLYPALDTLIPFEGLHPPFNPELSVQITPPPCQPSAPPQLQGLELQEQFHSFPPPQLYVPRNPVFVRDREINIWKLACQERVDYLLRRYGIDYIKALVESEARSVSQQTRPSSSSGTTNTEFCPAPLSQTKFRLYTPASYTYSSTSWSSTSGSRRSFLVDEESEDMDTSLPMDDGDWADADIDMEDEDEDDYEDDDETAEGEAEPEGEATLEAVQGLVIADSLSLGASRVDIQAAVAMRIDDAPGKPDMMRVDGASHDGRLAIKVTVNSEEHFPPRSVPSAPDPSPRPLPPVPHSHASPPPVTQSSLPLLSSLHVPLLSEPPRAFMGRGTPPDRRRLIEWSGCGRFATNGMGPPLYLSPVPQCHANADVGIVPMSVDTSIDPPPPHTPPTHGEWTSFLYSMLEGDGVGVGVGTSVGNASHASEQAWYELGLGSVPENALELPLSHSHAHTHGQTPAVEQPVEEGNNSSSTLRFALG